MIQTIRKAWGIPELRKKIIFTALILLIFRIGNAIPVPYVDTTLLNDYINQLSTTVLVRKSPSSSSSRKASPNTCWKRFFPAS